MKNGIVRSPLFYVGDKYKLMQEIKKHFPTNIGRFIEPFVGGGSVFLNVDADSYLLNDIDSYVIDIHRMLCSYVGREEKFYNDFNAIVDQYGLSNSYVKDVVPQELKKEYPKTYIAKYNKQSYINLKNDFNQKRKTDILMLYVLLIYGFNRILRFNKSGDFNVPVGDVDFNKNTHNALDDYFNLLKQKQVQWYSMDYRQFFKLIELQPNDFVYLDPPYLITSSEYNKLWNEESERDLLRLLDDLDSNHIRFAISNVTHYRGQTNDIFIKWSNSYNSSPIKSNYISFNDNTIKNFNEVLVTNF